MKKLSEQKLECLRLLLRPIIRFCLRHSLSIQQITELTKASYVELAAEEMRAEGENPNVSRLRVITGLHRRDIVRLLEEGSSLEEGHSLILRVIGQWENSASSKSKSGEPKELSFEQFKNLVSSINTDVNPAAVLFELERNKIAARSPKGIRLTR